MRLLICCLLFPYMTAPRFFDSCPSRRISIGACLAGLCPAGSECINGYCCKTKPEDEATSTTEASEVEYGTCEGGEKAIGECISNSCPVGYFCQDSLCCNTEKSTTTTTTKETFVKPNEEYLQMRSSPAVETTTSIGDIRVIDIIEEEELLETTTPELSKESVATRIPYFLKTTTSNTPTVTSITEVPPDTPEDDDEEEEEEEDSSTTTTTTRKPRKQKKTKPRTTTTTTTPASTTTTTAPESSTIEIDATEMTSKCPVGGPIGECIANRCPEGHSCLEGLCCILTPQINCTDELVGCLSHLCDRKGYKEFMTANCAKTCARCHLVNVTTGELADCRDRRSDCEEWASEGFCQSSLYTTRQKIKFCGKSCKLC